VIAPDLPGFGDSSARPEEGYDLESQVQRLRDFVSALGLERIHVVGNSMGGHLAAALLQRHPSLVRSLSLIDAAGVEPRADTEFTSSLREGRNLLLTESARDFRRLSAMMFVHPPWIPARVLDYLGRQASARRDWNERVFSDYFGAFAELEHGPVPPRDVPALIVWGREDRVLPVENVPVFAQLYPQAEVHVLEDTGHLPMLERPRALATHYRRFLDRLDAQRPAQLPISSSR
jgi:abhydrolase domain-containing protein 6